MTRKEAEIVIALLSIICLTGCRNETGFIRSRLISGATVISEATKCSNGDSEGELIFSTPITTQEGQTLYLNAYLSDMDESFAPGTKGTEITTEKLRDASLGFGSFFTQVYDKTGAPYVSKRLEQEDVMNKVSLTYGGGKWNFTQEYYWPENPEDKLTFCSYAPASVASDEDPLMTDMKWEGGKFSFKYSLPAADTEDNDAVNQPDILVGVNSQSNAEGSDVTIKFYHALTAVRFIKGSINGATIENIGLHGFASKGTCTVTPSATPGARPSIEWSNLSDNGSYDQVFDANVKDMSEGASLDKDTENKSRTFMMIPQTLNSDSEISVFVGGLLHPKTIKISDITETMVGAGNVELVKNWSSYAGKVITFMITSTTLGQVCLDVTDKVSGNVKSDLEIKNVGTSNLYIRAVLVGNWMSEGNIVASWSEDIPYGTFEGGYLGGSSSTNWIKGSDGFYYYKKYVPAGQAVKTKLFDKFTVTSSPTSTIMGEVAQIDELELSILVQAVAYDASKTNARNAWGDAAANVLTTDADN